MGGWGGGDKRLKKGPSVDRKSKRERKKKRGAERGRERYKEDDENEKREAFGCIYKPQSPFLIFLLPTHPPPITALV